MIQNINPVITNRPPEYNFPISTQIEGENPTTKIASANVWVDKSGLEDKIHTTPNSLNVEQFPFKFYDEDYEYRAVYRAVYVNEQGENINSVVKTVMSLEEDPEDRAIEKLKTEIDVINELRAFDPSLHIPELIDYAFTDGEFRGNKVKIGILVEKKVDGIGLIYEPKFENLEQMLTALTDIANVIEACHKLGIIYRDHFPTDYLIDKNNRGWLVDFGGTSKSKFLDVHSQTYPAAIVEERGGVNTEADDIFGFVRSIKGYVYDYSKNKATREYLESLDSQDTEEEGPRIGITTLDVINRIRELENN